MTKRDLIMYMKMAEACAEASYATKLKVGCVIVTPDYVMVNGRNGTPTGWDNTCEDKIYVNNENDLKIPNYQIESQWLLTDKNQQKYYVKTKDEVIHAESNALMKLAKSTINGKNSTMIITHSPCGNCAKLIYQAGISEIYYKHEYRSSEGIEFLEKCGIKVVKFDDLNLS